MADIDRGSSLRSRPVASMANETKEEPALVSGGRNPPHLPTPLESLALLVYPTVLAFGAVFSALSPQTRAAPYDVTGQSHVQSSAPSYFARKNNLFNTLFVKRGWAWVTVAFAVFALTQPALAAPPRRLRAAARWAAVTAWWVLVTQWCFGPALIDRGFRFTGGRCQVAEAAVDDGVHDARDLVTAVACKAAGGRWAGGHDVSGHVFLLVLGSWFLLQEVFWVLVRAGGVAGRRDDRTVVLDDGAVKGAGVEAGRGTHDEKPPSNRLSLGAKFALGVVAACLWMLLMTAIYFHTWFEKVSHLYSSPTGTFTPRLTNFPHLAHRSHRRLPRHLPYILPPPVGTYSKSRHWSTRRIK